MRNKKKRKLKLKLDLNPEPTGFFQCSTPTPSRHPHITLGLFGQLHPFSEIFFSIFFNLPLRYTKRSFCGIFHLVTYHNRVQSTPIESLMQPKIASMTWIFLLCFEKAGSSRSSGPMRYLLFVWNTFGFGTFRDYFAEN